mmetsp:Transcript_69261/g.202794  ORF Transcript_69261/g.202794 Transcript_69261/m.202794 type:complete len:221 (-) Transcript_69261:549-1211(-)
MPASSEEVLLKNISWSLSSIVSALLSSSPSSDEEAVSGVGGAVETWPRVVKAKPSAAFRPAAGCASLSSHVSMSGSMVAATSGANSCDTKCRFCGLTDRIRTNRTSTRSERTHRSHVPSTPASSGATKLCRTWTSAPGCSALAGGSTTTSVHLTVFVMLSCTLQRPLSEIQRSQAPVTPLSSRPLVRPSTTTTSPGWSTVRWMQVRGACPSSPSACNVLL